MGDFGTLGGSGLTRKMCVVYIALSMRTLPPLSLPLPSSDPKVPHWEHNWGREGVGLHVSYTK